jgi:pimeloyl-ACP methyl ester carboxylesterase
LNCPELAAGIDTPLYPPAMVRRCRAELEKRADLRFYGTQDAVLDLEDVRRALGYAKLALVGISYGSTFVQRYVATFPGRVEAAILIAPVPAAARPPLQHAALASRRLETLFAECRADPSCSVAFTPQADLRAALGKLSKAEAERHMEALRTAMYLPSKAREIPYVLRRASRGDFAPWKTLIRRQASDFSDGVYLTITCAESIMGGPLAAARQSSRATPFGDYRIRRQIEACRHWPRARVAKNHFAPLRTSVPLMIFAGRADPVASPEWAAELARQSSGAVLVDVPSGGHGLDGVDGLGECFDSIALTFLKSPSRRPLDIGCAAKLHLPPFKLADQPQGS